MKYVHTNTFPAFSFSHTSYMYLHTYMFKKKLHTHKQGIGEGAIVLGQLLGYDDENERLAVLDAGLAVRGIDFANELISLTEEALEGFSKVQQQQQQVDPDLVKSVKVINERIQLFIEKEEEDKKTSSSAFQ